MSIEISVGGKIAKIPSFLPTKGWSIHNKGYLIYTSRASNPETTQGIKRGARAHRVVVERIIGRALLPEEIVHHMDFDKLNCCWCNLLLVQSCFNPSCAMRDPYTGEFMSIEDWRRRYGYSFKRKEDEPPDWVKR